MVEKPTSSNRRDAFLRRVLLVGILVIVACDRQSNTGSVVTDRPMAEAAFVGGEACAECHQGEAALWQGSHHDLAMQDADVSAVLGDFDNAEFRYGEVTTRFYRRDGEFWVSTDGPDGELTDFEVIWTFGVEPLQQYLVELSDGRVQALGIAWDTRPAEVGGQRWFHLYPDEAIDYLDPLHWTGVYQAWNTSCADCHSTNLIKRYEPETDRFGTSFTSIDIDCESCHGPGSTHTIDPAILPLASAATEHSWVFEAGQSIAFRLPVAASGSEIEVCAPCHSRRAQLSDAHEPGDPLLNAYRPALLEAGLYHADGQVLDEVYVYGSFVQSAMAAAGVTCSDCHEPHSVELRADGNAVCARCHLASHYDQPSHHRHQADSEAAQCMACHMRAETYMVVDARRDHSFRVPRPDLSIPLDSPNACNDCHREETSSWAAARVAEWYPDGRQHEGHFGLALHAGRTWAADARGLLARLIEDETQPEIARATALSLLAEQMSVADISLIERSLNRGDPMLLLAGIDATSALAPDQRIDLLQRFLTDDRLAVRIAAARALLTARGQLSSRRQADLDRAITEYLDVQGFNGDRPEGLLNTASVAVDQGRYVDAERLYLDAVERHPGFPALYVNLSDLYRLMGRSVESVQVLRDGIRVNPQDAGLHFALALALVRDGRPAEALPMFTEAAERAPGQPYYQTVLAVAYNAAGDSERALEQLRAATERFPGHAETLFALATMLRDVEAIEEAYQVAERLNAVLPGDPNVLALLRELEQKL